MRFELLYWSLVGPSPVASMASTVTVPPSVHQETGERVGWLWRGQRESEGRQIKLRVRFNESHT